LKSLLSKKLESDLKASYRGLHRSKRVKTEAMISATMESLTTPKLAKNSTKPVKLGETIKKVDWMGEMMRDNDPQHREDLLGAFCYSAVCEITNYASCSRSTEIRDFLYWANELGKKLCRYWTYNGFWKIKGTLLQYILIQSFYSALSAKDGADMPDILRLFEKLKWNVDECRFPHKYTSEGQTVEDVVFDYSNGAMTHQVAFVADTEIKLGSKWKPMGGKFVYTVVHYDLEKRWYELESNNPKDSGLWYRRKEDITKWEKC
jgi:hypothetical protein